MLPYWILKVKRAFKKAGAFGEVGQTLIEYALILALIAVVIVVVLTLTGVNLSESYERIAQSFPNLNIGTESLSIGYSKNMQGYIRWFIEKP
jgi:pilus assembly protein Flp/PilA